VAGGRAAPARLFGRPRTCIGHDRASQRVAPARSPQRQVPTRLERMASGKGIWVGSVIALVSDLWLLVVALHLEEHFVG
jgi:hypothetical protein